MTEGFEPTPVLATQRLRDAMATWNANFAGLDLDEDTSRAAIAVLQSQMAVAASDAEVATALANYATTTQLVEYVDPAELATAIADFVNHTELEAYVDPTELTIILAGYATTAQLQGYVDPTELSTALAPYLTAVPPEFLTEAEGNLSYVRNAQHTKALHTALGLLGADTYQGHLDSLSAHGSDRITYSNPATAANRVKTALDALFARPATGSTVPVSLVVANPSGSAVPWTDMPTASEAAPVVFRGAEIYRGKIPLHGAVEARIIVNVGGVAGAAGAKIGLQYSTDATNWLPLGAENVIPQVGVGPGLTNSIQVSPTWTPIADGAKGDVFIRACGWGGDGVIDPTFGLVFAQFNVVASPATAAAVSVVDTGNHYVGSDVEAILQEIAANGGGGGGGGGGADLVDRFSIDGPLDNIQTPQPLDHTGAIGIGKYAGSELETSWTTLIHVSEEGDVVFDMERLPADGSAPVYLYTVIVPALQDFVEIDHSEVDPPIILYPNDRLRPTLLSKGVNAVEILHTFRLAP